ncbi:hypothetical protein JXO52_17345 [bacterium]|nr:hypothetical protein [bacterium]
MKIFSALFLAVLAALPCAAQQQQTFMSAVKGDSVYLFMRETPKSGSGYLIERRGPRESEFVRLTERPLTAVWNPDEARARMGDDYDAVARMLQANTPVETLLKLRSSSFYGGVLSLVHHRVGTVLGRYFAAGGHVPGGLYTYRVISVDRNGRETNRMEKSITVQEQIVDPVSASSCEVKPEGIVVSWQYPPWRRDNDTIIRFYLSRSSGGEAFRRIPQLFIRTDSREFSYLDTDVEPGITYRYSLTAADAAGVESAPTEPVAARFLDLVPPAAPVYLAAEPGDGYVTVTWGPNTEFDLHSYNIYRARGLSREPVRLNPDPLPPESLHYVDSTAAGGVQYFYSLTAVDSTGNESPRSLQVGAVPFDLTPPGRALNLTASVKDGIVTLAWDAPPDSDLSGFWVSRGLSAVYVSHLTSEIISGTSISDSTGLEPGKRYVYTVEAVDSLFNTGPPLLIRVHMPDNEPPHPVEAIRAAATPSAVRLQWNSSPSLDIASYLLDRTPAFANGSSLVLSGDARAFTDTTVSKGTAYRYTITAVDSAENRSPAAVSAPVTVRDNDTPLPPSGAIAVIEQDGVRVTWKRNTENDLAGYNVYRSNLPTGIYTKLNATPLQETVYLDTDGNGQSWYRVRSVDTSGNESDPGRPSPVSTNERREKHEKK